MSFSRILRGLFGIGTHKLAHRLEHTFGDIPSSPCGCTPWREVQKYAKTEHATYLGQWRKVCRGPGGTRFYAEVTSPATHERLVAEESRRERKRVGAEARIDVYETTANDKSEYVGRGWKRVRGRVIGQFPSANAAKRAATKAVARWCEKTGRQY